MSDQKALDAILDNLRYEVTQARLLGAAGQRFADDLARFIEQHRGDRTATADVSSQPDDDDPVAPPKATDAVLQSTFGQDPDDPDTDAAFVNGLVAELDQDTLAQAAPQDIVLHVRRTDGFTLGTDAAEAAVRLILTSIENVVGTLTVDTLTVDDEDTAVVHVRLIAGQGTNLHQLGAGRDGFNAVVPLIGVGDVNITSRVGDPADPQLAAELGLIPPDLPTVPDGQHPINGILQQIEDETGTRPRARGQFVVHYTKDSGDELTTDEVITIVNHRVSQQGLRRLGTSVLLGVDKGERASTKTAVFGLTQPGEIDLATLALNAAQYRGTFDFSGTIGVVTANGEATLDDADVNA